MYLKACSQLEDRSHYPAEPEKRTETKQVTLSQDMLKAFILQRDLFAIRLFSLSQYNFPNFTDPDSLDFFS